MSSQGAPKRHWLLWNMHKYTSLNIIFFKLYTLFNFLSFVACSYLGQTYQNDEQWFSYQDPCRRFTCKVWFMLDSTFFTYVKSSNFLVEPRISPIQLILYWFNRSIPILIFFVWQTKNQKYRLPRQSGADLGFKLLRITVLFLIFSLPCIFSSSVVTTQLDQGICALISYN